MQNFALNGGTLDGDPEVWFDNSPASVVFQAAGEGMRGAMGQGTASIVFATAGALALQAKLQGQANIQWAASGSLLYGVALAGGASIQVSASLNGTRWAMLQGQAPTVFQVTGDIQVVPAISSTFVITLASSLDLHVATGQHADGLLPIEFRSVLDGKAAKSQRLMGYMPVQFAGISYPALTIKSPAGAASIQFKGSGEARFGGRLSLEGRAAFSMFAVAHLRVLHYVYAEGSAAIRLLASAAKHGIPNIPGLYVEAPPIRALRVGEEVRRFIVPAERRI